MADPKLPLNVYVRLSAQQALLGAIPSSLRLVTATFVETVVQVCFVFDGPIHEDDLESARLATTQIISDFPSPWKLEEEFVRLDYPAELNQFPGASRVYERKERTADGDPVR